MKNNVRKITSIALSTLIIIGSTATFASSFKDVSDDYWAVTYIEKGKQLGLINGDENGKFNPTENISRLQSILLSARLLDLPQAEIDKAKAKHKDTMKKNNIPDWAVADLSVALSRRIVDTFTIENLMHKNGSQNLSSRENVTVYVAKAMGLQSEAEALEGGITLPFTDKDKADKVAKPYIYIMEKHGVINGDENKNFNPKNPITRAEMSKVIVKAHEYMEKKKGEVVPPKPEPKPDVVPTKTVTGSIFSSFVTEEGTHVVIELLNGEKENYKLSIDSVLMIDGKVVSHSALVNGLKVKVEVVEGKDNALGYIKTLTAESKIERIYGTIYDVRDSSSKSLGIEYKENNLVRKKIIPLKNDAIILLDGKVVSFSELKIDDKVNLEIINDSISEVNAEAYRRDLEGILKDVNLDSKHIEIELKDGTRAKYNLHKNADVIRNNRSVNLNDLRKGDKVQVRVEDKQVIRLDAEIVRSTVDGKLVRKTIDYNKSEITVSNYKTGKNETYSIPYEAVIEIDKKRSKLDDLELGFDVKVDLEGEEVVSIRGQATILNKEHLGRIIFIGRDTLEMRTIENQILKVNFANARIIDRSGAVIYDKYLKEGDEILVTGETYQNEINATEIMKRSN